MKINILPPKIFNLLAAGEVVENPASVVKECVENSLDAGSTSIEISIKNGGLDEIIISDNGHGISESEIEKVFLPHATSKIEKATDLERIESLGFRGEAMSSIASVSKVILTTKVKQEIIATEIYLDGGEIVSRSKIASKNGTIIRIKNLFYNTPARKKFLSSPSIERNKVTNIVQKLILANPGISWRYIIDDQVLYQYQPSDGEQLLGSIGLIYGNETTENVIKVINGNDLLGVSGYISVPTFVKRNRSYQTVMINGRTVDGGIIADAINDSFSTYMTVGNFPFFVLDLTVDVSQIDVNVHPRKAQVRFEREDEIYHFVKQSIVDTIDAYLHKKNAVFHTEKQQSIEPILLQKHHTPFTYGDDKKVLQTMKFIDATENMHRGKDAPHMLELINEKHHKEKEEVKQKKSSKQEIIKHDDGDVVQIIGSIFDCYVLLKTDDKFVIIDQHAAHERLLYDELKSQIDNNGLAVQSLIEPLLVYLTPTEINNVLTLIPHLERFGFEIEIFGSNCVRILSVPLIISSTNSMETFLINLLGETTTKKAQTLSSIIDEKIIASCCRHAIKAGKSLTHDQITMFLTQFKDKKITPTCPHGRPIMLTYSKVELEKLFARK